MAKDLNKFAHPEYIQALPDYTMVRDCFNGSRAVKEAGTAYLPQLTGQQQTDYDNYKYRALFFPITSKTAVTMVGLATTKPPKCEFPKEMADYFKDTENEYQFTETYVSVFTEVLLMGRYGILLDSPQEGGDITLCPYIAENIVNWEFDDQSKKLKMLLLKEHYFVAGDNKFERVAACRYRHCYLNENGTYCVEMLDDDLEPLDGYIMMPMFDGRLIDFIPFTPFGATGLHYSVDKPPMLDISTINISHYLSSADLEWGRHIVGLPTPVITGMDSGSKLHIGGTAAWVLPNAEAKAFYLEFMGGGLKSLENAMTEKVGLMSSMSARMIDNSTRGSEAAETVKLRYMSESAGLIHTIGAIEGGLNAMYNQLSKLKGLDELVKILFSREIIGVGISLKDMKVLFDAYFQAGISKETLLYNLRRLEAVDPNRSDADELSAIRNPPPPVDPNKPPAAPTPSKE
jgi:hypothetical protein